MQAGASPEGPDALPSDYIRYLNQGVEMGSKRLPPGTRAPVSGIYERIGPRGGRTGEEADSTRGKPLPPTETRGSTWTLRRPAHHKHKA